jgi:hypothetical protein
MYLGDAGTLGALYLLSNLLECPLHPTSISIILEDPGLRIRASCVPPSVLPREPGLQPYFIELCTRHDAPIDKPATIAALEHFDPFREPPAFERLPVAPPFLVVANALSGRFQISSITSGVATTARFERGVLLGDAHAEPTSDSDGLDLSFTLDDLPPYGDSWAPGLVAEVVREFANLRRVPVDVTYLVTGNERRFLAEPGAG